MTSLAEQKKLILPYLQRADEIQGLNPKVAYYCRLHAIGQGLQIPERAAEIQGVLELLMEKLEQDKPAVGVSDEDAAFCEAFAIKVFKMADKQDRDGKADAKTVKAFYAASIFIDVLEHFGELPPDMVERKQYAFWKAADIRKALREGRKPEPGPPVTDDLGLDLPDIPGNTPGLETTSSAALPPTGPPAIDSSSSANPRDVTSQPSSNLGSQSSTPTGRFRPGSKVYYNSANAAPAKGTVVSALQHPSGIIYRVALSQQVLDIPEPQLAHDFKAGDSVLFRRRNLPPMEATVDKFDANRWPVAYLLTLADGSVIPTKEDALSPLLAEAKPPDTRSSSVSPERRASGFHAAPSAGRQSLDPADAPAFEAATRDENDRTVTQPSLQQHDSSTAQDFYSTDSQIGRPSADVSREESQQNALSTSNMPDTDTRDAPGGFSPLDGQPHFDRSTFQGLPFPEGNGQPGGSKQPGFLEGNEQFGFPPARGEQPGVKPNLGDVLSSLPPPSSQQDYPELNYNTQQPLPGSFPQGPPTDIQPKLMRSQPEATPVQSQSAMPEAAALNPSGRFHPPLSAMTEAQKMAKYAVSSLSFEDVPTAIKNLQKALDLLTVPGAHK